MNIHQLQASYSVEHDRILVRLNTHAGEELRLWLTRRMVRKLFPHMIEASAQLVDPQTPAASHDGADHHALNRFRKQEALECSDFQTPFSTDVSALPIGAEPLLATSIHIVAAQDGCLRIGFEEKVPGVDGSRGFEVNLALPLLHAFLHLLESALKQTDWGISLAEVDAQDESNPLQAFAAALPPKYLN